MPMLENPRSSLSILVKNGCNNGGRGWGKVAPWLSVLGVGGRRDQDIGFVLWTTQLSVQAQGW